MGNTYDNRLYGIEVPPIDELEGEKVLEFLANHAEAFEGVELPEDADAALEFAEEFERPRNRWQEGPGAMIAHVAGFWFEALEDSDSGLHYVGFPAMTMHFPWTELPATWRNVTKEEVYEILSVLVTELYGYCPPIEEHTVWIYAD